MVSNRPFIKQQNQDDNRSPSPYTKLPTPASRARRSSALDPQPPRNSELVSNNKFLQPHHADHARNRSVSLPESAPVKIPLSPSAGRTPRPSSIYTPSRLPRPSDISTTRSHHRQSASLDISQRSASPSKLKSPTKYKKSIPNTTPRRSSVNITSTPRPTAKPHPHPHPHPHSHPHPHPPLHIDVPVPSVPKSTSQPILPIPEPRRFTKRDPRRILECLRSLIDGDEVGNMMELLPLDVMSAIHERELMEDATRFQRTKSTKEITAGSDICVSTLGAFGYPLRQIALYASTKAVLGGFEHNIPIVVFACVEELYRSGISTPSNPTPTSPSPNKFTQRTLSSSPPDLSKLAQPRVQALSAIFDSASHKFGLHASLVDEASDDVYALLTLFLSRLPEPVVAPIEILHGLRNAFWTWCVKPSTVGAASQISTRIRIAQMLLGLLPTPNLSLFVYLMAFSCQVLEVRMKKQRQASAARDSLICGSEGLSSLEAQMLAFETELEGKNEREKEKKKLGRAWGGWLFGKDEGKDVGGPVELSSGSSEEEKDSRSTRMMAWFVTNWSDIIRGFFEHGISVDADMPAMSQQAICRMNMEFIQSRKLTSKNPSNPGKVVGGTEMPGSDSSLLHLPTSLSMSQDSLFASSVSLNRLRENSVVISPDGTPKPSSSYSLKMGLVRGQSYGKPNPQTLVPAGAEEGSIHSRYSAYNEKGGGSKVGDSGVEPESETMVKEVSQSSVSALNERLLDLRLFAESDDSRDELLSGVDVDDPSPDERETDLTRQQFRMTTKYQSSPRKGPLRVANPSDSEAMMPGREYSGCSSTENDSDSSKISIHALQLTSSSNPTSTCESKEQATFPEPNRVVSFDGEKNKTIAKRCDNCADDCPAHSYARELELMMAVLVKENEMLKRDLGHLD
ncbi:hypothetical protein EV360DRAFT_71661 [Lentinula raphanica]|nr:hypothetical protein EV360DRAFT_71661 [Lentinula raphanica]